MAATDVEKKRYYWRKVKTQLNVSDEEAERLTAAWIEGGEYKDSAYWREEEEALSEQARSGDFRIFCLTPQNESLLMWAHYADSHRGICLQFRNTEPIGNALSEVVPVVKTEVGLA